MSESKPTLPTLGAFEAQALLGTGATARVFQALDPSSGIRVAIKVLHPHLDDTPNFAQRFEREVRASQALDHPGIAQVLAHGYEDGQTYLVMECVPGHSLKRTMQERGEPLPVRDAVHLVATVAETLAYAHSQGVVHRDVKPSNILLRDGRLDQPVLSDFGVAKLVEATLDTASGKTLGTPAYMSPEQGQGRPADARSDVYALGAVLFELLTGRPPFEAESPYAVVLHHVNTPPPCPADLRPDLPQAVEQVVLKALAKNSDERYPSAAAFASALRASLVVAREGQRSREPDPIRPARRTAFALLGLSGLLTVLVALALAWSQGWLPIERSGVVAARNTPVVESLILQGRPAVQGAWLDPDLPERVAKEDPKVHLQGPSTPDRIAYRLASPELPPGAEVLSATLALYTVPWGEDNRYATLAAHRLLRDWDPGTANYLSPWSTPGLQTNVDYQTEPFQLIELDELLLNEGWLEVDITSLAKSWSAGDPNHGLLIRLTDDSFGMAHLWVYTGEYEDPNLRPKFSLVYRRP